MDRIRNRFAERVLFFRKTQKHMTQEALAQEADLSQGEVSRIEKGKFRDLTRDTISKLARAFEIEPEMLVSGTQFASDFGQSETADLGSKYDGPPFTLYFASALTGLNDEQLNEIETLDERVHRICKTYSKHPLILYRPRLKTSPKDNPDLADHKVYDIDEEHVATADIVVLAAVFPSLGAGMEFQLAYKSCKSVILLVKVGQPLSRMVTGCPAVKKIVRYENLNDLESGLVEALGEITTDLTEFRYADPIHQDDEADYALGHRIADLLRRRLTAATLAKMVGVEEGAIDALMSKPEQVSNPSLRMLRRIARAFGVSEALLITGHELPIQLVNPIFAEHLQSLRAVADETKMEHRVFDQLWKTHVDKYQYELSVSGASYRADIGHRRYWQEQFKLFMERKEQGGDGLF